MFEGLLEFNFEDGCNELRIQFSIDTDENEAKVELLSDMKVVCLIISNYMHEYAHRLARTHAQTHTHIIHAYTHTYTCTYIDTVKIPKNICTVAHGIYKHTDYKW